LSFLLKYVFGNCPFFKKVERNLAVIFFYSFGKKVKLNFISNVTPNIFFWILKFVFVSSAKKSFGNISRVNKYRKNMYTIFATKATFIFFSKLRVLDCLYFLFIMLHTLDTIFPTRNFLSDFQFSSFMT